MEAFLMKKRFLSMVLFVLLAALLMPAFAEGGDVPRITKQSNFRVRFK
jgi:biotin transporter BioY